MIWNLTIDLILSYTFFVYRIVLCVEIQVETNFFFLYFPVILNEFEMIAFTCHQIENIISSKICDSSGDSFLKWNALSSPNSSKKCGSGKKNKPSKYLKQSNKFIFSKPNNLLIKLKQSTKKICWSFDLMVNFEFNYE